MSQIPDVICWWFKAVLVTREKPCSRISCELAFAGHSTGVVWGLSNTPVASVGGKCWGKEWKGPLKEGCQGFLGLESFKYVLLAVSTSTLLLMLVVMNVDELNFSSISTTFSRYLISSTHSLVYYCCLIFFFVLFIFSLLFYFLHIRSKWDTQVWVEVLILIRSVIKGYMSTLYSSPL